MLCVYACPTSPACPLAHICKHVPRYDSYVSWIYILCKYIVSVWVREWVSVWERQCVSVWVCELVWLSQAFLGLLYAYGVYTCCVCTCVVDDLYTCVIYIHVWCIYECGVYTSVVYIRVWCFQVWCIYVCGVYTRAVYIRVKSIFIYLCLIWSYNTCWQPSIYDHINPKTH